jgi:fructan beta-fructosidase
LRHRHTRPVAAGHRGGRGRNGQVTFTAYLDRSSVEVLAQGGQVSVTDLIYPPASATGIAVYAVGGKAKAVDIKVTPIRP